MTNFEKNIHNAAREYALSHDERAKMSRMIRSYMAMKPLRNQAYSISTVSWFMYLHRPIAAALVLVLISTTGITYAAEAALPGDALYSVKTYINEPVKVALATSAEAKADAHIEIAERRIEEAATLAAEGRLDATTENDLAVAFQSSADAARENIAAAQIEDSDSSLELASRFETRLLAHENVLAEVAAEGRATPEETMHLTDAIRSAGIAVAAINTSSDAPVVATLAADVATESSAAPTAMMAKSAPQSDTVAMKVSAAAAAPVPSEKAVKRMKSAAERSLKSAQRLMRSSDSLSTEARASSEVDIQTAVDLVKAGDEQLSADARAEAFASYQSALQICEQTIVHLKAAPTLEKARARARSGKVEVNVGTDSSVPVSVSATVTLPVSAPAPHKTPEDTHEDSDDQPKNDSSSGSGKLESTLKLNLSL